ncbi:MAG: FkbM family methyltransferase [Phycisphaeraceae bacterium]|nr:FkbM family methyltransferase [Phycisphaeraceae bacterium]
MGFLFHAIQPLIHLYQRATPTEHGALRLARLVRRLLPRVQWAGTFTTPDGLTLDLDLATYPDCCMALGLYELATARLIRRRLQPGDHFVDAGANLGYFTLLAARIVGPTGRVDAFEPQPDNRQRLIRHVQRHNLTAIVRVHPLALSNRSGETVIHGYPVSDDRHNHGCASMFGDSPVRHTVPTGRLDEVLAGTSPRMIKMDVEGAEDLVVEGMAKMIQVEHPPWIVGEYNVEASRQAGVAADAWLRRAMMLQPRYGAFRIDDRLRRITLNDATMRQVNVLLDAD